MRPTCLGPFDFWEVGRFSICKGGFDSLTGHWCPASVEAAQVSEALWERRTATAAGRVAVSDGAFVQQEDAAIARRK